MLLLNERDVSVHLEQEGNDLWHAITLHHMMIIAQCSVRKELLTSLWTDTTVFYSAIAETCFKKTC